MIESDNENKNNLDNILKAIIEKMEHNDPHTDNKVFEEDSSNTHTTIAEKYNTMSENLQHLNLSKLQDKMHIHVEKNSIHEVTDDLAFQLLKKLFFQWLEEKQYNINDYMKPNLLNEMMQNTLEQKLKQKLDFLLKDIDLKDIVQSTITKIVSEKLFNR